MPIINPDDVKTLRRVEKMIDGVLHRRVSLTPTQRRDVTGCLLDQFAQDGVTLLVPEEPKPRAEKTAAK